MNGDIELDSRTEAGFFEDRRESRRFFLRAITIPKKLLSFSGWEREREGDLTPIRPFEGQIAQASWHGRLARD